MKGFLQSGDVPGVNPFQYDGTGQGAAQLNVNLFRGAVSFYYDLMELPERGGLGVKLQAMYHGDIHRTASFRNQDAPTSVLGLGWEFGDESILWDSEEAYLLPEQRQYYYCAGMSRTPLYRADTPWQRGRLDICMKGCLAAKRVSKELAGALRQQGLPVNEGASMETVGEGSVRMIDSVGGIVLFLIEGEGEILVMDGGETYENAVFDFSRIRYYRELEKWEITYRDGSTSSFGGCGTEDEADALSFTVVWRGWQGASVKTGNEQGAQVQQRIPWRYHLRERYNQWGDRISFHYNQILQEAGPGGLLYTKACYLKEIQDMFGHKVKFKYGEKEYRPGTGIDCPREFWDPHKRTPDNVPNAWQSCYETKYLEEIAAYYPDGSLMNQILFDYELAFPYHSKTVESQGDMVKRLLTSITLVMEQGRRQTVTMAYMGSGENNAGAIRSITYPEGARVSYTYAARELPGALNASRTVPNPFRKGAPRVWFGPDYCLVFWVDGGYMKGMLYTFAGRWQAWDPGDCFGDMDPEHVCALTEADFLVMTAPNAAGTDSVCLAIHKDDRAVCGFEPAQRTALKGAGWTLCSGDGFYLLWSKDCGRMEGWLWNRFLRRWQAAAPSLPEPCAQEERLMKSYGKAMAIFCYDPNRSNTAVYYFTLTDGRDWVAGERVGLPELALAGGEAAKLVFLDLRKNMIALSTVTERFQGGFSYDIRLWLVETVDGGYKIENSRIFHAQYLQGNVEDVPGECWGAAFLSDNIAIAGGRLYAYNGDTWLVNENLAPRGRETLNAVYAYTEGCVLKTEYKGAEVSGEYMTYRPESDGDVWKREPVKQFHFFGEEYARRGFPSACGSLVSWDLSLYNMETFQQGEEPFDREEGYLPADADTVSVFNQGPEYLAFRNCGEDDRKMGLTVFRNGTVLEQKELSEGFHQMMEDERQLTMEGRVPGNAWAFYTYEAQGEDVSAITLRWLLGSRLKQEEACYQVARAEIDSGFSVMGRRYEYDINHAVCDNMGQCASYYRARVYPDLESGREYGYTDYYYHNSLALVTQDQNQTETSLADGQLTCTIEYNSHGKEVSRIDAEYEYVSCVAKGRGEGKRPICGVFLKECRTRTKKDGVESSMTVRYDDTCGLPSETLTLNDNALGQRETYRENTIYGAAVYDRLAYLNDLISEALKVTSCLNGNGTGQVIKSHAAVFRDWERQEEPCAFAACARYQWQGGKYQTFNFARPEQSVGWKRISEVTLRGLHGVILEKQEPAGRFYSSIYDRDEKNITATVSQARVSKGEAFYYGFEEYETPPSWELSKETPVEPGYYHTGSRCLCIPGGKETAPLCLPFSEDARGKEYMILYWMDRADSNSAGIRVILPDGRILKQEAEPGEGWRANAFFFHTDTAPCRGKDCKIHFYNRGHVPVYMDNISLSYPHAPVNARVYRQNGALLTSVLGPYDECRDFVYDDFHRNAGEISRNRSRLQLIALGLCADSGLLWNSRLVIAASGSGNYERFDGLGRWRRRWLGPEPPWQADDGRLSHIGSGLDTLEYRGLKEKCRYFAGFFVHIGMGAELSISLSKGVTITWRKGKFVLADQVMGKRLEIGRDSPGYRWVAVWGESALFFVDGVLLFSYLPGAGRSSHFGVSASGEAAIRGVLLGEEPQVGFQYFDKMGRMLQGHSLNGSAFTVTGLLYDRCGRAMLHTKPVRYEAGDKAEPLRYRENLITAFNPKTGILSGETADAYPEDEGYPYVREVFEDKPGGRVVQTGAPGRAAAVRESWDHAHTVRYRFGCNGSCAGSLSLPPGKYYMEETLDADGNIMAKYQDKVGTKVAETVLLGERWLTTSYLTRYESGHVEMDVRLANWHDSRRVDREKYVRRQILTYTGKLLETQDPDTGTDYFVYLDDGRLRFSQDEILRKEGKIFYRKYNKALQITEEGIFTGTWDREKLGRHTEDLEVWPGEEQQARIRVRYTYDGSRSLPEMGQLVRTEVFGSDGEMVQTAIMQYDEYHRLCARTVSLFNRAFPDGTLSLRHSYEYDAADRLTATVYSDGRRITCHYDQEGKVTCVRDKEGRELVRYEYGQNDVVCRKKLGHTEKETVEYRYNSRGWPVHMESSVLAEDLEYEKPDGEGPYNGKLSRIEVRLKAPAGQTGMESGKFPGTVTYKLKYDKAGRLQSAGCLIDGVETPEWSLGIKSPIQYDDNGNITQIPVGETVDQYKYEPGTNRISRTEENGDYSYDEAGRTVSAAGRGIRKIDYQEGRLLPERIETDQCILEYWYDEGGRRLARGSAENLTVYLRNSAGKVLEEVNIQKGEIKWRRQYLYGPNGLEGYFADGKFLYAHLDHLGSLRGVTGEDGSVKALYSYNPYGKMRRAVLEEESLCPHGFCSYEWDEQAGVYFSGARLYDPSLRAFYGADPKRQYASPYLYCGNDPFSMVDPTGESSWWAILTGAILGILTTLITGLAGGFVAAAAAASTAGTIAASTAVGAIAGAAGALTGATVTAAVDSEPITGSLMLSALTEGAVGGAAGALTGSLGQTAMRAAMNAGWSAGRVTALGYAVSATGGGLSGGAASLAAAAAGGNSLASGSDWLNVGIGTITGIGAGILSSNAFFGKAHSMPVVVGHGEYGQVLDLMTSTPETIADFARLNARFGNNRFLAFIPNKDFQGTGTLMLRNGLNPFELNGQHLDVIAVHGFGRKFFPVINGNMRVMYQKDFIHALVANYPNVVGGGGDVKLLVCFGAMFGKYSNAKALATAMNRNTYSTVGPTYPARNNRWVQFQP